MGKKSFILILSLTFLPLLGVIKAQPVTIKPSNTTVVRDGKTFFEHVVEKGHTLFSISRAYEVSIDDITRNNPGSAEGLSIGQKLLIPHPSSKQQALDPATVKMPEPMMGEPDAIFHVVRKGETLFGISKIYDVSVEAIVARNPGSDKGISEGERLRIPLPLESKIKQEQIQPAYITYQTKRDDNLLDVANRFGISVDDILKANPQLDLGIGRLKRGTELRIPQITETIQPAVIDTSAEVKKPAKGLRSLKPCKSLPDNKQTYKVALLLPLYSRSVEGIQTDPVLAVPHEEHLSFRFIQFLEGALLAIDTLREEGVRADFHVFDIDEDTNNAKRLLRERSLEGMDLIIGPLFSAPFNIVSEYAVSKAIPIVNPLSQRDEIVEGNPYVFKIIPSPLDRMKAVASYSLEHFPDASLHVLHRPVDREVRTADSFVTVMKEVLPAFRRDSTDFQLITGSYVSVGKLRERFARDRMNVIFTLSSDQVYVLNFLRNLTAGAKDYPLLIFGLPAWPEFTGMEPQYLLDLNIHMFANSWVDYHEPAVRSFVMAFRERFDAEPDQYAYLGYDITRYFLAALLRYGREFPACVHELEIPGLQSRFKFRNTQGNGFTNTYTHIYRYQDFKETDARKHPVGEAIDP